MIIRVKKRDNPYVIIDKTALDDPRLSFRAKGILAYLLSRPDNWTPNREQLADVSREGRDAVSSALNELKEFGYFERKRERQEDGTFQFVGVIYEVSTDGKSVNGYPPEVQPSEDSQSPLISKEEGVTSNETPSADKPRFPAEWYRELEAAYQETKGIVLSGPEFGPLQRDLKLIFKAGHEPQTVREFMSALEKSDEAWTDGWTIGTVRMKLPEWVGGKLKLGGNGKPPENPELDAIRADIRQQEAAITALDRELTRLEYIVHPVESFTRREQPAPTAEQLDRFDELKDLKAEKERDLGRLRKQREVVR